MPSIELPNGRILTGDFDLADKKAVAKLAIDKGLAKPTDFPEKYRPSFELGTTFLNLPGSAWKEAKDLYNAVTDLPGTYKALEDLTSGAAGKILPESMHAAFKIRPEQMEIANLVGQDIENKYLSGGENFLAYLQRNPAGVLSDLGLVLTGGGGLVKGAAKAASLAKIPGAAAVGKVGGLASQVGANIDPLNIAGNIPGAVVGGVGRFLPNVPTNAYASAARIPEEQAAFALAQDVLPNRKGLRTLEAKREGLVEDVQNRVAPLTQTIPSLDVLDYTPQLRQELATNNPYAYRDLAEYDRALNQHLESLALMPEELSAPALQAIKTRAYREAYPSENPTVTQQVGRAVAGKAKETLEGWDPEIGKLNEQLAQYEKILPTFANKVRGVSEASDPLSRQVVIPALVSATTGTPAGTAATTALSMGTMPVMRARAARYFTRKGNQRLLGAAEATPFSAYAKTPFNQLLREIEEIDRKDKLRKRREAEKR